MTQVNTASHEAYHLIAEDAIADDEYIRIGANALGICASGAADGIGTPPIAAPWPAVLEHAPTAELVAALKGREGVEVEELSDNWHEFNITVPTTAIFVERRP